VFSDNSAKHLSYPSVATLTAYDTNGILQQLKIELKEVEVNAAVPPNTFSVDLTTADFLQDGETGAVVPVRK
jgi:hypothetical protein